MRISEALLNESIVGDLRNSIVRGLKPEYGPGTEAYENILKRFDQTARWGKANLKKSNDQVDNAKIVWMLQWLVLDSKVHFLDQGLNLPSADLYTDKEKEKIKKQASSKNVRIGDTSVRDIWPGGSYNQWVTAYEHFRNHDGIGNRIRELNFKPETTPNQALEVMQNIESDWIIKLKDDERALPHSGSIKDMDTGEEGSWRELYTEFIKFPDGSAWFDLDREFCSQEGKSMGHCGNTASWEKGDTILSYRIPHQNKPGYFTPHLTFIMDANSFLGEMKGYANKKPSKKYHEVIKTLLMDDRIAGVKGGGYLPEENFSVWDLDDGAELVKKKTMLAGDNLEKYMFEVGLDEGFETLVGARLGEDTVFEIEDRDWASKANKGNYLYKVDVKLTDTYNNFAELIDAEFHDSPYNLLLKYHRTSDAVPWDTSESAQAMAEGDQDNIQERFERIMQYSPPAVSRFIIEELAHYSGDDPSKIEDNIWEYLQNHGGEFSDWITGATSEAVINGFEGGIYDEIRNQAVHHIEGRENNYFGWGAKEAELTIKTEKPGRFDLHDNKMYITAPLMEMVEIIQDMEGDGEQLPSDWWSGYAVESDDLETFSQENIMENISWDYITAIKDFSQSMMHSPNLHDGEAFHEKYDRIRQGKGDPLYNMTANRLESIEKTGKALSNESHKPKGKRKLFKLAQMLTNTNSEKAHAKLHKVCARLGLSADQCHAITSKAGYT